MKVKVIQSSYDTMFEDMVNDFISKHKVDHIDTHVQVIHNSLTYIAIVFYREIVNVKDYRESDLYKLGLSKRVVNALLRSNVCTVEELLLKLSEDKRLRTVRNLGYTGRVEILDCLNKHGYDTMDFYD